MSKDFFEQKAGSYEKDNNRVTNVVNISKTIKQVIDFEDVSTIIDFGSGTGLLLEQIAPLVDKITAIDISSSMNQQLAEKKQSLSCDLELLEMDLTKESIDGKYDGIISSMTLHHIEDISALFNIFYELLNEGGFIALADLDEEDGSFHIEDTGVHHLGFKREEIKQVASDAGFKQVETNTASTIKKPYGDYPVFLLTATK